LRVAESVFNHYFFDAAAGVASASATSRITAFAGAEFEVSDIEVYLASFAVGAMRR